MFVLGGDCACVTTATTSDAVVTAGCSLGALVGAVVVTDAAVVTTGGGSAVLGTTGGLTAAASGTVGPVGAATAAAEAACWGRWVWTWPVLVTMAAGETWNRNVVSL